MNLVDSSAWLEYFADGPNASFFARAIENTRDLVVPTIVIYEVYKWLSVQRDERTAQHGIGVLRQGKIVPLSAELAIAAASLSQSLRLPMADSIILATARSHEAVLWTQDSDFKDVDGVQFRARRGKA